MFRDELFYCRKYFDDMLKKSFIRFNHFSIVLFVLFVKKLKNELRFCVNYRNLNVMIIKNRYSIFLIREILHRLIKVKIYIKFNIIVVYNVLRMIFEKKNERLFFEYVIIFMNVLLCSLI